jgi:alkylhydroperoxidase family enzyme
MARISYADIHQPALAPIVERIVAERGSVLKLYEMLLHSPPVAAGWLTFLSAIRQQCQLSGRIRELVIMRVAVINGAEYEFRAHTPFALKEGFSQGQIDALREDGFDAFTDVERAALAYSESMTRNVRVPQAVFDAVRRHFNERELVELTATIGAYNLVSRFLEALQVDHDDHE